MTERLNAFRLRALFDAFDENEPKATALEKVRAIRPQIAEALENREIRPVQAAELEKMIETVYKHFDIKEDDL